MREPTAPPAPSTTASPGIPVDHDCIEDSCGGLYAYFGPCGGCCCCLSACVYEDLA